MNLVFSTRRGALFVRGHNDWRDPNRYVLPILSITWTKLLLDRDGRLVFRGAAICWWSWALLVYYARPTGRVDKDILALWQEDARHHRRETKSICWLCHQSIVRPHTTGE